MDDREAIEKGRQAIMLETVISDYIIQQREDAITKAIAIYRGGTLTPLQAYGLVAELAALGYLVSNLQSDQRRGTTAAEREYGSGKD